MIKKKKKMRQELAELDLSAEELLGVVWLNVPAVAKVRMLIEQIATRPTAEINGMIGGYTGEGAKTVIPFFFSSRRRHTISVSAFLLNRSSDLYGEQWIKFMKDGVNATPLPTVNTTGYIDHAAFLGTINPDTNKIPKHLFQGYLNIYNNYFKAPWMPDRTEANPNELNQD